MTAQLTHSGSTVINATPEEVYAVVSDVTRTGEWSPICRKCEWDEGAGPSVGAFFTGHNKADDAEWQTRSQVTAADPGSKFSWSVGPGLVNWGYELKAVDGGTELTETWEFPEAGHQFFVDNFGDRAPEEIEKRRQWAHSGIPETLAAIKRIIED